VTLPGVDLHCVMGTSSTPQAARNGGDKEGRKWDVKFIDKGGSNTYGFSGNWRGFCIDQVSTCNTVAAAGLVLDLQTHKAVALHAVATPEDSSALLCMSLREPAVNRAARAARAAAC